MVSTAQARNLYLKASEAFVEAIHNMDGSTESEIERLRVAAANANGRREAIRDLVGEAQVREWVTQSEQGRVFKDGFGNVLSQPPF